MRSLFWKWALGILLAVALSHSFGIFHLARRMDDERSALLHELVAVQAGEVVAFANTTHGPDRERKILEFAETHDLNVHLAPAPPPHAPPQVQSFRLADGSFLIAAPDFMGPPPLGFAGLLLQLVLVIGVVFAVVTWLLRPLAKDLGELSFAVDRIGGDRLGARVPVPNSGPLREVSESVNRMADRIEHLVNHQRQLFQSISHELRTPHARIRFRLDALERAEDVQQRTREIAAIEQDLTDIDDLLGELLAYLKLDVELPIADPSPWSAEEALAEAVARIRPFRPEVRITLQVDPEVGFAVPQKWFVRAAENLLSNAQRYAKIDVIATVALVAGAPTLLIDDDGPGIPEADREALLAPFQTGDRSRSRATGGIGLGLAIVSRIAEKTNGQVRFEVSPIGGARVGLHWPSS